MNARWIILVYILKIHLKTITCQHHHHHHHYYDDTLQQYDDEDDSEDSDESYSGYMTRRRAKHRKAADSEECYCSCDACFSRDGHKPCCTEFCKFCNTETDNPNQDQYANHEQKVVFVPFPYPLIVPNAQNDDAANEKPNSESPTRKTIDITTQSPVTRSGTEKPVQPVKPNQTKLRSKSVEVGMLSRHRQMKQLNPAVKRVRPAWVPKYGIVPIPDHLAAKLMTQLTEVRALKAKRL